MPPRDIGAPRSFAHYDRRNYRTLDIAEGYAAWARSYGELDDRMDIDLFEASARLGPRIAGARVVDLACGTGRIGRWLAARGASSITGVDLSPHMLEGAQASGVYAELRRADFTRTELPAGAFDGAITSLALCHLEDLQSFFVEAHRLLAPSGWLAVADFHPYFMMLGVPTHFPDPDTGEQLAITNHIHALRDFFRAGVAAGFEVREIDERFVTEEWATALPGYRKHLGLPISHYWFFERS